MPNTPKTTIRATIGRGAARDGQPAHRPAGFGAERVEYRDAWVIALEGEIDAAAVRCLQHEVSGALTGYDRIVIDLHGVSVLSAPTLALLCGALRDAHRPGARLELAGAAPAARRSLQLCALPGIELLPPADPVDGLGAA